MQGLARNVFLGDLTLEFDAVGAVLGHGFHPWKPGKFRSIPNLQSVHRLGRTPKWAACRAILNGMRNDLKAQCVNRPVPGCSERSPLVRFLGGGVQSVRTTAAKFDVNPSTVQRIARPFVASVAGAA